MLPLQERALLQDGTEIDEADGAASEDGKIYGTYFHGLFDFPDFRNHYLKQLDSTYPAEDAQAAAEFKQTQYDLLADHFEQHLDMDKLLKIIDGKCPMQGN